MIIFYDVDTQRDFMNSDGALPVPGAEKIKPNLKKLTEYALKNKIQLVGSSDRHFEDDDELKEFPPHCMDGTMGLERIEETRTPELKIEYKYAPGKFRNFKCYELDEVINPPILPRITIEKQTTDVFSNPYTSKIFEMLDVKKAITYGVATDYCVKDAVLGMLDRGIEVYLVTDAIAGINENSAKKFLKRMYSKGAIPVKTAEVLGGDVP